VKEVACGDVAITHRGGEEDYLTLIASMGLDVLKELKCSHPRLPVLELRM
jgi:hypothetical protein